MIENKWDKGKQGINAEAFVVQDKMHLEIKKTSESTSENYLAENLVLNILNIYFFQISDFFILKIVASFDQHKEEKCMHRTN